MSVQDDALKKTLLENYLKNREPILPVDDINYDNEISLDEFKRYVEKYFDTDNTLRKLKILNQEKKREKDKLSEIIMTYMNKYNIEDLNTKFGKIRCKTSFVNSPVSQKNIKEQIATLLDDDATKSKVLQVFDTRNKVEKTSLRRLKIS